jgi:hypothetical protein
MKRKIIVLGLVVFGFSVIAASCSPPSPEPVEEEVIEETEPPATVEPTAEPAPEETEEPAAEPTLAATLTAPPTTAPAQTQATEPGLRLAVIDGPADQVDCLNGAVLETTTIESDIRTVILEGLAENVLVRVGFTPEVDLAAWIAALNLPFSIQVGIADPEFPFPPEDPAAFSAGFQNSTFLFAWLNSAVPIANIAGVYCDGAWGQLPGGSPATIEFTSSFTATVTIPNSALPQAGSLYVISVIDNRICDPVGVGEAGPAVRFEFNETWFAFVEEE